VANTGCYPTASLLAIFAASGSRGIGRQVGIRGSTPRAGQGATAEASISFGEVDEDLRVPLQGPYN